jgi:hypothetical protein
MAHDIAQIEGWLAGLGRKVEVTDVTEELRQAATAWAVAYTGNFDFMLDMRADARSRQGLSVGKAKGVLNCWRADVNRRPKGQAAAPKAEVQDGFYTDGKLVWKVQVAVHGSGNQYAKVLSTESGSFVYTSGAIGIVRKGVADGSVVPLTLEIAKSLGHLYGRCMVCGRTLTDEGSIAAGIGPICAGKFHQAPTVEVPADLPQPEPVVQEAPAPAPEPEPAPEPVYEITPDPAAGRVFIKTDLTAPGQPAADAVKALPGRSFDRVRYGNTAAAHPQVLAFASKYGLNVHPDAVKACEAAQAALEAKDTVGLSEADLGTVLAEVSRCGSPADLPPVFVTLFKEMMAR